MAAEPSGVLSRAALFAARAPSLHNSQPWHWFVGPDRLDLRLEPGRRLHAADPDARLAVLSCGAALHHARIHLAAAGQRVEVVRAPAAEDPDLLARLSLAGRAEPDHDAMRLVGAAARRHSDRRGATGAPLDLHRVRSVGHAVRAEGAGLAVLRPRQVFALAEAVELAEEVESADPDRQIELAGWVGGLRPSGTGVPSAALPDDPRLLTAPARVLRRAGPALIGETHEHTAVFAVLHTAGDTRADWLVAGEGLSAGWLTATALDVAMLPLSVVTEVAGSRDRIRGLLGWSGYPHLVLRLAAGVDDDAPRTPRLTPGAVVTFG
jgi:hypothetical protein